ncbi:hypothetical protein [Streptomyces sp. I05A-00742]|uniref:hypothetical protein n=1 Tax=Streptomyces sp. I05A-00742 TaxID=2732853 RepID=UPI002017A36B|nr:hypothetical protein [Streptomyces sp. I05A-00742]
MRRVTAVIAAKKQKLAQHRPAITESRSAQDSAKAPPDDKEAQGKAADAEKMNAAKPGETIDDLKNLLMGILAKAASAITEIAKDPIGFLGNLVRTVDAGLQQLISSARSRESSTSSRSS